MINFISKSAMTVAKASNGNPAIAMVVVIMFCFMFSTLGAGVERLIFGERFEHWLDPIFSACFIFYSGLCVFSCSRLNYGDN